MSFSYESMWQHTPYYVHLPFTCAGGKGAGEGSREVGEG